MSFQWIIDSAVDVTYDKSGTTSQSMSRDSVVRTVSRGAKPWKFSVTPCPGLRWIDADVRANIEECTALGTYTQTTIGFTATKHNWIFGWQGTGSISGLSGSWTIGSNTLTVSGSATFKAGDVIKLGSNGHVYSVAANGSGTLTLNRQIIDATGSASLIVGSLCTWQVFCVKIPQFKITPLGFIEWQGTFDFVEAIA